MSSSAAQPAMKITAIAPWFGGKRTMAPTIVQQLGKHRCYWEPFCGSMAVLLEKPACSQETVNDLHGDLINLALVVRDDRLAPALYRRLRRTLVHEGIFWQSANFLKAAPDIMNDASPDLDRAYHFFVASWVGRNGVIGTRQWNNNFCVRYTLNGGIQGTRFASAVDSIPAWRRRLRKVTILRRDGFLLLEKIEDQDGVAIYVDPPYLPSSRGSAVYTHDLAPADHKRLARLLSQFRLARVVVSYYDSPELAELYPAAAGWKKLDCSRAKGLAVQGQRGSKGQVAPEVLLVNGPIYGSSNDDATDNGETVESVEQRDLF